MQKNSILHITTNGELLAIILVDLDGSRIVYPQDSSPELEQKISDALFVTSTPQGLEERLASISESYKKAGFEIQEIKSL